MGPKKILNKENVSLIESIKTKITKTINVEIENTRMYSDFHDLYDSG